MKISAIIAGLMIFSAGTLKAAGITGAFELETVTLAGLAEMAIDAPAPIPERASQNFAAVTPVWFDASRLSFVLLEKPETGGFTAVLRSGGFSKMELGVFVDAGGNPQVIFIEYASVNPMGAPKHKVDATLQTTDSRKEISAVLREVQKRKPVGGDKLLALNDLLSFLEARAGQFPHRSGTATTAEKTKSASAAPVPIGSRRHQFRINATLYSESALLAQPAVMTMGFNMESEPNVNGERQIRDLEFNLELLPEGGIPTPRYTMSSPGPGSQLDFYPPDPEWGQNQLDYAQESGDKTLFFIEARSNIDARAGGTVLDGAIKRLEDGRTYGAKALLKIYPYCSRDLSSCSLGQLAGITYDHWGLGWFNNHVYPDYRLISEQTFSLAPVK